jgi:hypothetical protein
MLIHIVCSLRMNNGGFVNQSKQERRSKEQQNVLKYLITSNVNHSIKILAGLLLKLRTLQTLNSLNLYARDVSH